MIRYWHWLVGQKKNTLNPEDYYHIWATMNDNSRILIKQYPKTQPLTSISGLFNNVTKADIINVEFEEDLQNVTNASSAFKDLTNLTTIVWAQGTTLSEVTNASYMFYNCDSLNFSCVNAFTFNKVTNANYMFGAITNASYQFSLSNATFANVTQAISMFAGSSLSTISLSNATFDKATNIRAMFEYTTMSNLSLPLATFDSVTDAEEMFFQTTYNGETLSLPEVTFDSIQGLGNMFFYTTNSTLRTLSLPKVTFKNLGVLSSIFNFGMSYNVPHIETIDLSSATFENVYRVSSQSGVNHVVFSTSRSCTRLKLPQSSTFGVSINLSTIQGDYDTLVDIAGWLKDLSNDSSEIIGLPNCYDDGSITQQQQNYIRNLIHNKNWKIYLEDVFDW